MSNEEFEFLLHERATLTQRHTELCEICNENYNVFRGERPTSHTRERDRIWAKLEELQATIDGELQKELDAEERVERRCSEDLNLGLSNDA